MYMYMYMYTWFNKVEFCPYQTHNILSSISESADRRDVRILIIHGHSNLHTLASILDTQAKAYLLRER
jgi:hypothetical protein